MRNKLPLVKEREVAGEVWPFCTSYNCRNGDDTDLRTFGTGVPMKKLLVVMCSVILAFGLAGCVGKAPVGKGKAPVVQTRG